MLEAKLKKHKNMVIAIITLKIMLRIHVTWSLVSLVS